jgi:phenylacetate-CoA ligase
MDELSIEIEDRLSEPSRVATELQVRLGLTVAVCCVEPGTLPRSDFKSHRWIDQRRKDHLSKQ